MNHFTVGSLLMLLTLTSISSCSTAESRRREEFNAGREAREIERRQLREQRKIEEAEKAENERIAQEEKIRADELKMKEVELLKAKELADGTVNKKEYCGQLLNLQMYNKSLEHEKSIGKEVGVVDYNKLYSIGEVITNLKKIIAYNQVEYKKKTGKKLTTSNCKD